MDTMRELLAAELRATLARRRISAVALARRLGWSQTYMARRVDGRAEASVSDLQAIAAELGIALVELLPREARQTKDGSMSTKTSLTRKVRNGTVRTIIPPSAAPLTGRVPAPKPTGHVTVSNLLPPFNDKRRLARLPHANA